MERGVPADRMVTVVAVVAVAVAKGWLVFSPFAYPVQVTAVAVVVAAARQVKEVPEAVAAAVHSDSLLSTQPGC